MSPRLIMKDKPCGALHMTAGLHNVIAKEMVRLFVCCQGKAASCRGLNCRLLLAYLHFIHLLVVLVCSKDDCLTELSM